MTSDGQSLIALGKLFCYYCDMLNTSICTLVNQIVGVGIGVGLSVLGVISVIIFLLFIWKGKTLHAVFNMHVIKIRYTGI